MHPHLQRSEDKLIDVSSKGASFCQPARKEQGVLPALPAQVSTVGMHDSLADLVQRCSGHVLHGAAADVGFEPEQSFRFLFHMVRVSSQSTVIPVSLYQHVSGDFQREDISFCAISSM